MKFSLAIIAALAILPAAAPAMAADRGATVVDPGTEKINQVIVYGDDPCPASTGDEITVCARLPDKDRYRIPKELRGSDPNNPATQSWVRRAEALEYVGRSGTDSCSPVGAGGFTGCFAQIAQAAKEERKKLLGDASWADLVSKEREKRLSVIDADSAKIEAEVKAEEQTEEKSAASPTPPPATNSVHY